MANIRQKLGITLKQDGSYDGIDVAERDKGVSRKTLQEIFNLIDTQPLKEGCTYADFIAKVGGLKAFVKSANTSFVDGNGKQNADIKKQLRNLKHQVNHFEHLFTFEIKDVNRKIGGSLDGINFNLQEICSTIERLRSAMQQGKVLNDN